MIETIGLHGAMWFFSFGSLFSGIFVYFYLPETNGKSIDQIIEVLSGKFK
jgi:H+/Cl- antiporter ClcA